MKKVKNIKFYNRPFFAMVVVFIITSCIDVLDIEEITNSEGSGLLVVEAILTDEVKNQVVYLSRSDSRTDLERDTTFIPFLTPGLRPRDTVNVETGALVKLLANNGLEFAFTETRDGLYRSDEVFGLQTDIDYQLEIVLDNGNEYTSQPVQLQGKASLDNVYAERTISENGVDGVAIFVDGSPIEGVAENYRYNYVETYQVIAPFWVPQEFRLTNYTLCPESDYTLEVVEREVQNRVCYNTIDSNEVIQTSTFNNTTNNIERQLVRFIGKDNFIISHRYSILVKQLVQSSASFAFYETLRKFSNSESLFSQIQPGELPANITRKDGTEEPILGWVEAVSVSEQRLFFDFEDFFLGEELPLYPFNCNPLSVPERTLACNEFGTVVQLVDGCPPGIVEGVDGNFYSFFDFYSPELVPLSICPGDYVVVPSICGDCRLLGSNIEPNFWEE
ncbi:MAG: DUF4249 domain-containing protein [Bacteroidota bacterium]